MVHDQKHHDKVKGRDALQNLMSRTFVPGVPVFEPVSVLIDMATVGDQLQGFYQEDIRLVEMLKRIVRSSIGFLLASFLMLCLTR